MVQPVYVAKKDIAKLMSTDLCMMIYLPFPLTQSQFNADALVVRRHKTLQQENKLVSLQLCNKSQIFQSLVLWLATQLTTEQWRQVNTIFNNKTSQVH